jgi:hypothetical protein
VSALIHIEPGRFFHHFPATSRGLAALLEDCQPIPAGVYSVHLWAHLWWEERRVDFTMFHAGLLTEDFVHQVDTTYNCAARPFVPSASGTSRQRKSFALGSLRSRTKALVSKTHAEARALAGLALYPAVQKVWPDAERRLRLGRGHWAYKSAVRRFKALNAVEADPATFVRLRHHLADLPGMHLDNRAVCRSDTLAVDGLLHSGPLLSNTCGGNVIFGGRLFDAETQEPWRTTEAVQSQLTMVPLDEVLFGFPGRTGRTE